MAKQNGTHPDTSGFKLRSLDDGIKTPTSNAGGKVLRATRENKTNQSSMGVSKNRGTPKSSKIINFNRVFHYKPSILGYHYFWKHSYALDPPELSRQKPFTLRNSLRHAGAAPTRLRRSMHSEKVWPKRGSKGSISMYICHTSSPSIGRFFWFW